MLVMDCFVPWALDRLCRTTGHKLETEKAGALTSTETQHLSTSKYALGRGACVRQTVAHIIQRSTWCGVTSTNHQALIKQCNLPAPAFVLLFFRGKKIQRRDFFVFFHVSPAFTRKHSQRQQLVPAVHAPKFRPAPPGAPPPALVHKCCDQLVASLNALRQKDSEIAILVNMLKQVSPGVACR